MTTSDDDFTRTEAARILGFETIQGVRALERSGRLRGAKDDDGVVRFSPRDVERVRAEREAEGKPVQSSAEVDTTIRRDVTTGRASTRRMTMEEASRARLDAMDVEERVEAQVRARNKEKRAAFEESHLEENAVVLALGIEPNERHSQVHALRQAGLLRRVEAPKELVVCGGYADEPLRIEDGLYPLVLGGPFYAREDVLRLRAEAMIAAASAVQAALPADQKDMLAEKFVRCSVVGDVRRTLALLRHRWSQWPNAEHPGMSTEYSRKSAFERVGINSD